MKKTYIRPAAETLTLATEGMIATSDRMVISDEHEVSTTDGAWTQKKGWGDNAFEKNLWEE